MILDEKYKIIAKELGFSTDLVKDVCESQFKFLKKKIEEPEFSSIRLQYLGVFRVKPKRLEKINQSRKDGKQREAK